MSFIYDLIPKHCQSHFSTINIVAYSARELIYMLYFVSWRNSLDNEFIL